AHPTVLAIDTTAGACSVAITGPRGGVRQARPMTHGHSRHVFELLEQVMSAASVQPRAIDAIAFGSGPGSFTGLRIACGIAQGLGFGWSLPLVAVDSLRTLAQQAFDAADTGDRIVRVALDLRMGEVAYAVFRAGEAGPVVVVAPLLGTPEQAAEAFDALGGAAGLLAGDGFDRYPTLLGDPPRGTRPYSAIQPDAAAVARLGALDWCAGRTIDAADAAPTYLRDRVALDVDEQAALRAARRAGAAR
ncbi:MAG: tRNA (adenosine(37)-N6)-threonylcarbamoyltransferase complex dimerization subunit type 1 TsaB, partial [Burkholderiaceae bacterium]